MEQYLYNNERKNCHLEFYSWQKYLSKQKWNEKFLRHKIDKRIASDYSTRNVTRNPPGGMR